ncbi:MAG: hypothetical protein KJ061_12540 [Vicinamibacteraceae bacterium]|nr:hypothetical protein [Vicinamibacteraceae bacterium]
MSSRAALWFLALVLTLASAYWQRTTGPTYPARGQAVLGDTEIRYRLMRTHAGEGDQPVRIEVPDSRVRGTVVWRRYPTREAFREMPMRRDGDWLEAALPHQPPAGKLEYQVRLTRNGETASLPAAPAVTRFKGEVSPWVLIPHIVAMFMGMMVSTRAGLGALAGHDTRRLVRWTLGLLIGGGLVLGPVIQTQAFGDPWTGVPFGWDLTDNKTLVAVAVWLVAAWRQRRGQRGRVAVVAAALATLVVFLIPHSVWGSEIRWDQPGTPRANT